MLALSNTRGSESIHFKALEVNAKVATQLSMSSYQQQLFSLFTDTNYPSFSRAFSTTISIPYSFHFFLCYFYGEQ